jgi:hypothetical protein
MARDEIEGRKKRGNFDGPTGETVTRERVRDGESADGRAGGTGERVPPNEERLPKRTTGNHMGSNKKLDEGGI